LCEKRATPEGRCNDDEEKFMKLYNSIGPNPRLVRMFLLEKELTVPFEEVDIMSGANRRAPYTDRNPIGQIPALELDDGTVISETVPICEYFEAVNPSPALIGSTPEEQAVSRMWTRRIELHITEPVTASFRYGPGAEMFKDRIRVIPEAAEGLAALGQDGLEKLDGLLGSGPFLAGDRFTLGDIVLYCFLDFAKGVGQSVNPEHKNVGAWFERVSARPSAEASLHPAAAAAGMRA